MSRLLRRLVRFPGSSPSVHRLAIPRGGAAMEALESRRMLSGTPNNYVVTDTSDSISDTGSLRYALSEANTATGDSTITFGTAFPAGMTTMISLSGSPLGFSNTSAKVTIIGAGGVDVDAGGGGSVFVVDPNVTAELDGVTISGGFAGNTAGTGFLNLNGDGGGVYNFGTLSMNGDTLQNNSASHGGGVLNAGTLTVNSCTFTSNVASASGGALGGDTNSVTTINGSTFTNNSSANGTGGVGIFQGALNLNDDTFTGDTGGAGGAVEINSGSAVITNSILSNNTCTSLTGTSPNGGGFNDTQGTLATLTDDTISGNTATDGGGIYATGNIVITACTIANNIANQNGAGLYSSAVSVTLINSTVSGNSATSDGGGIEDGGTTILTDCTVAGNVASTGAGILNQGNNTVVDGTIIATNTNPPATGSTTGTPDDWDVASAVASSNHDLIGDGGSSGLVQGANANLVGSVSAPTDPMLAPLATTFGPTQTMALLAGNPAIGAGAPFDDAGGNLITVDQRGISRPANPDIGAYQTSDIHLAFGESIPNAGLGVTFTPPVTILVEDTTGAVVTSDTSTVTLALSSDTLGGMTSVAAVNGVATFSSISVPVAGVFTITANDGAYASATSTPFVVGSTSATPGTLTPSIRKSTVPATVVAGLKVKGTVTIVLTNQGGLTEKGKATINIDAATNAGANSPLVLATLVHRVNLKPMKTTVVHVPVRSLPAGLGDGAYILGAQAIDPIGGVRNASSGPNLSVAAPFIALSPTVGAITPGNIKVGKHGNMTVTLLNIGNIDTSGMADLNVGLSTNGTTETATLANTSRKLIVKAGKKMVLHLHFVVPANETPGTYLGYFSVSDDGDIVTATVTTHFTIVS